MQKWAESFYKSSAWKKTRDAVWKRDGGLCVDCLKAGRITPAEEIHHVIELTQSNIGNAAISLSPSNLVSLCRECHRARHGARSERRYRVDNSGRVTIK